MGTSEAWPHVLIIGGFLTEPLMYRPMRERLLARGAARVSIAPIHLPDWLAMAFAGMGPLMLRGARAIRGARREAPQPLLVVGHSMGGIVARLAMSDEAFEGRRAGAGKDVACLVTLGTPHVIEPAVPWRHPGVRATVHLARVAPGAFLAPRTSYLTVGSTLVDPARRGPVRTASQLQARVLLRLAGDPGSPGDGLIADESCRMVGVRHVALPDILHGTLGAPWYGNDEAIDRWWPVALEGWHEALEARAAERP